MNGGMKSRIGRPNDSTSGFGDDGALEPFKAPGRRVDFARAFEGRRPYCGLATGGS